MNSLARKLAAALALLLLAAALSGCAHLDARLTIHADGSADYGMDILLADAALDTANAQGQDILARITGEMEAAGFTVTPKQAEGYTGISMSRHYDDASMIGADGSLDKAGSMAGDRFSVKAEKGFFGTKYTIDTDMDAAALLGSLRGQEGMAGPAADEGQLMMSVTLPVKAARHNAPSVSADGLTYTWQMKIDQPSRIELAATVPNVTNLLLAGGGVLAMLLLAVLLVTSSRKKRAAAAQRIRSRAR